MPAAQGEIATGIESVVGYKAKIGWGVGILDIPIEHLLNLKSFYVLGGRSGGGTRWHRRILCGGIFNDFDGNLACFPIPASFARTFNAFYVSRAFRFNIF